MIYYLKISCDKLWIASLKIQHKRHYKDKKKLLIRTRLTGVPGVYVGVSLLVPDKGN